MALGKVWLPCSKQPGFVYFKTDHSVSKGLGWYFSLPECGDVLARLELLSASVHLRGSAFISLAGF